MNTAEHRTKRGRKRTRKAKRDKRIRAVIAAFNAKRVCGNGSNWNVFSIDLDNSAPPGSLCMILRSEPPHPGTSGRACARQRVCSGV